MTTGKTGPNDGNYDEDDQSEREKGLKKDEKFKEEMGDLEEISKEMEERKKEKLKQFKKREIEPRKQIREEEETKVGGQVTKKKVYGHKRGVGVFIRNKTKPEKIRKGLKKIHGLSTEEKKLFSDVVTAYNPTKSVIKKDKLKKLLLELKHIKSGRRGGTDFKKLEKTFSKEFLKKNFGSKKRKIIKIERELFGKKDPLKHKMKSGSNRTPTKGKPGSYSPMSKVGKRF